MKILLVFAIILVSYSSFAQNSLKDDSIYYLLDSSKTYVKDRMWEIHEEYPSLKVYTIQCACLVYDQKPIFVYNTNADKGRIINKSELKSLTLIDLVTLLDNAKKSTARLPKQKVDIFIIEPKEKDYVIHKVHLLTPTKPREPTIDFENIAPRDSAKAKNINKP